MLYILLYVALGVGVGCFGSLIGAGGGFILTPILLLFFPTLTPAQVTGISMTTVMFNSVSGSSAYAWMKRIDYRTGLIFSLAALPGTVFGTLLVPLLPRNVFNVVFGAALLIFSALIIVKSRLGDHSAPLDKAGLFRARRRLHDRAGHETAFSFNMAAGIVISLGVGVISGLLGIGGGIVHVPALVLLGFPAHFATATSHFVLALTSISSVAVHVASGSLSKVGIMAICIAAGAFGGGQFGARLSTRVKGRSIMLLLAGALVLAGARILWSGVAGLIK